MKSSTPEELGHCDIANAFCKAPAGFSTLDGIIERPERPIDYCVECGNTVCKAKGCSKLVKIEGGRKVRVCAHCTEDHAND